MQNIVDLQNFTQQLRIIYAEQLLFTQNICNIYTEWLLFTQFLRSFYAVFTQAQVFQLLQRLCVNSA